MLSGISVWKKDIPKKVEENKDVKGDFKCLLGNDSWLNDIISKSVPKRTNLPTDSLVTSSGDINHLELNPSVHHYPRNELCNNSDPNYLENNSFFRVKGNSEVDNRAQNNSRNYLVGDGGKSWRDKAIKRFLEINRKLEDDSCSNNKDTASSSLKDKNISRCDDILGSSKLLWKKPIDLSARRSCNNFNKLYDKYNRLDENDTETHSQTDSNIKSAGTISCMLSNKEVGSIYMNNDKQLRADEEEIMKMDLNYISSLALKYMINGDVQNYYRINNLLEIKKSRDGKYISFQEASHRRSALINQYTNEKSSMNIINKRRKMTKEYLANDKTDIAELIQREKLLSNADYESNFTQLCKNSKCSYESDEDGRFNVEEKVEKKRLKMINKRSMALNNVRKECIFCIDSSQTCRNNYIANIISISTYAYLSVERFKRSIAKEHMIIVPLDHVPSTTSLEEDNYVEIRNYQKSVAMFYDSLNLAPIFIETVPYFQRNKEVQLLGGGRHTCIHCFPIPFNMLEQAKIYFKKAFEECDTEWAEHKKIVEIPANKRIQNCIPKNIPYIHVDFSLGGGIVHVIEDYANFRKDLGAEVILTILQKDVLYQEFRNRKEHSECLEKLKHAFKPFDWTTCS